MDDPLIIKQAISGEHCSLLSEYIRLKAIVKPNVLYNQDPLHGVHRQYGDPLLEIFLQRLTPLIEQQTGLSLWPTLLFSYLYRNQNQLERHKDRSSCQYVASLCIDADAEFKHQQKHWPLHMELQGQSVAMTLNYGDIVIYKGSETVHWREPFPGQWYVSAIFGFVDQQGPWAFQKYDQRKQLGLPHVGMFRWTYGCLKQMLKNKCRI